MSATVHSLTMHRELVLLRERRAQLQTLADHDQSITVPASLLVAVLRVVDDLATKLERKGLE